MNDMRAVIVPKSDQINADDLLAGPMTITVTSVSIKPGTEQPVAMRFENDGGKPYKPCKSMARVLVNCWGPDASIYAGRAMTLYCDPKVTGAGMAVGGIRISHLSHIEQPVTMALTASKGNKKLFTVHPLAAAQKVTDAPPAPSGREILESIKAELATCGTIEAVDTVSAGVEAMGYPPKLLAAARAAVQDRRILILGDAPIP